MPADLRTIPNVDLVKVGTWDISTGTWQVTAAMLAATIAAHSSGTIPAPILKLGHVDERFDGEPALGRVENLRLADRGRTLVGDFVGVPAWLADIAASAFPNRSIEGITDLEMPDGTKHSLVLTAVALLGVTAPGVTTLSTLADIQALYGVAASSGTPVRIQGPAVSTTYTLSTLSPRQRVLVRAAANRRRHRAATAILAALAAEQEK